MKITIFDVDIDFFTHPSYYILCYLISKLPKILVIFPRTVAYRLIETQHTLITLICIHVVAQFLTCYNRCWPLPANYTNTSTTAKTRCNASTRRPAASARSWAATPSVWVHYKGNTTISCKTWAHFSNRRVYYYILISYMRIFQLCVTFNFQLSISSRL